MSRWAQNVWFTRSPRPGGGGSHKGAGIGSFKRDEDADKADAFDFLADFDIYIWTRHDMNENIVFLVLYKENSNRWDDTTQ